MYNYVDKIYDVIIPYTHNTAHVMIPPLKIIIIIHYVHYSPYIQQSLITRGLCTFKVLFIIVVVRIHVDCALFVQQMKTLQLSSFKFRIQVSAHH